jgi:hypothetical protein
MIFTLQTRVRIKNENHLSLMKTLNKRKSLQLYSAQIDFNAEDIYAKKSILSQT